MASLAELSHPAHLLLRRETGPRVTAGRTVDAALSSWGEASLTAHSSATYAAFKPPPRSTIALSYNCDGTLLASTQ